MKKIKKALFSRLDEKFKKILEQQTYVGYLTCVSLIKEETLTYDKYLEVYKEKLINYKKGVIE